VGSRIWPSSSIGLLSKQGTGKNCRAVIGMNKSTAGALSLCLLAAQFGIAEPLYVKPPTPGEQLIGNRAIVRLIVPEDTGVYLDSMREDLDYREQVFQAVKSSDAAATTIDDNSELNKYSSEMFKSVEIPEPEELIAAPGTGYQGRQQATQERKKKPTDPIGITSVEFIAKELTKSVQSAVAQPGEVGANTKPSPETAAVLAVTNDDLVGPKGSSNLGKYDNLAASAEIKPLESSFLYVLLCKIGLMPPGKVGLSDDCD